MSAVNRRIISASRRTDIPAFYGEWFLNRIRQGWAGVIHPYTRKHVRVSLAPKDVYALVLWSKNFAPFLPCLDELDRRGYRLYFLYTITPIGDRVEPRVPPPDDMVKVFRLLARRYPGQVQWRYDPLLITPDMDVAFYLDHFRQMAAALAGYTSRCYISFARRYPRAVGNFRRALGANYPWLELPPEAEREIAAELARIAGRHGITVYSCCNRHLVGDGVAAGSCVDYPHLAQLFGPLPVPLKKAPTRSGCRCYESLDIGSYDTCPHGCLYCYANSDQEKAKQAYLRHGPEAPSLSPGWRLAQPEL